MQENTASWLHHREVFGSPSAHLYHPGSREQPWNWLDQLVRDGARCGTTLGSAILALALPDRISAAGLQSPANLPEQLPAGDCGAGPEDTFNEMGLISGLVLNLLKV